MSADPPTIDQPPDRTPSDERALLATIHGLEVREQIGKGGMGSVYKAYQVALDRTVALKTVQARYLTAQGLDLFRREARALARVRHPHIVQLIEFHPEHAIPYFLMDFVEGTTLDKALKGRPWHEVALALKEVVATVVWAHDHGVVHGDLKPANILLDRQNKPHILDFGLARVMLEEEVRQGEAIRQAGTPGYLAPEVVAAKASPGVLSDVYALGVTLYVTLTGVLPFSRMEQVMTGELHLPVEHNMDIPEPLQRICLKSMERNPEDRYQTGEQMLRDLERFLEGKAILTRPTHYQKQLQGRIDNHLADVRMWEKEGLISRREMDQLIGPYQHLQAGDSPWMSETRRVLTQTLLIRVGAWLLLVSAILWPVFYWHQLDRVGRLASAGLPTVAMATLGGLFLRLQNRRNALACLGSFTLLLLVFVVVVLSEFRWLEYPQPVEWELWGEKLFERSRDPVKQEPGDFIEQFLLSNSQIASAALIITACIALLLRSLHAAFFASWLAFSCVGLSCSLLLLIGDKERILTDRVAWVALHCLVIGVVLWLLGWRIERTWPDGRDAILAANPFFRLSMVIALVAAVALARFGTEEWFDLPWKEDNEIWNLWLLSYTIPVFLFAWLIERYGTEAQRVLSWWLYLLTPVFLLVPLNLLFSGQGPELAVIGDHPVHL